MLNVCVTNLFATTVAIFLDIDGVVYCGHDGDYRREHKVRQLFPGKKVYDNTEWSIAATHFFDEIALKNLDALIETLQKDFTVQIVISSAWAEQRSTDSLINNIFSLHNFSKYIKGKIIDNLSDEEASKYCKKNIHPSTMAPCRASRIHHYLKTHPEVDNFIIFDDVDMHHHLSALFGEHFIKIDEHKLLTSDDIQKALKILSRKELSFILKG